MPYELEHHTVTTNGVNLHVAQIGPQDGPLLILLHGFPEFWYGWHAHLQPFAEAGYRVWAPDQRGYNLSDKPRGIAAYQIDTLANDIVGLIDAAGREQAFVVGHDWGAAVAWWLALRHPERVQKLGILNVPHPVVLTSFLRHNLGQLRKSWYIFFFQIPNLPERLIARDNWAFGVRSLKGSSRRGTFSDADLDLYRRAWAQPGAITSMINWYRAIVQRPPKLNGSPRIKVPTLVIWGAQDRFLSAALAQPSVDLCDDGRLVMIPEATHWVQHEEVARVNALLQGFLQ